MTTVVLNPASGNGAGLSGGTKAVVPADESAIIDNDISLGVTTHRFKNLYLSGNVNAAQVNLADAGGTLRNVLDLDSSNNLKIATGASAGTRGIKFFTENEERVTIDSSGNVLIGSSSLSQLQLDLIGANTGTNPAANGHMSNELRLFNTSATVNNLSGIGFYNSNSAIDARIVGIHKSHSSRHGEIGFLTHDGSALGERMRITANGNVGIGTAAGRSTLHIIGNNTAAVASNGAGINGLQISRNTNYGENLYLYLNSSNTSAWSGYNYYGRLESFGNNALEIGGSQAIPIIFATSNTERMRIFDDGSVGLGTAWNKTKDSVLKVAGNNSGWLSVYHNDGNGSNRYGIKIACGSDNQAGTNYAMGFDNGNFTVNQGYITWTSGTVTYGAFTAHHPCIIPDDDNDSDSSENAYPYGTLLETISLSYTQAGESDTERGIRYNVQKSSEAYSRKVLGAYGGSMNNAPHNPDNEHQALVLGDGHILCNGEKGNISVGDGICTSSTAGIGMKADKMAMIIGIAQEDVTFSGNETKLVAVQYGLQQFTPWTD